MLEGREEDVCCEGRGVGDLRLWNKYRSSRD